MKILTGLIPTRIISMTLILAGMPDAATKRFGGACSFGGKLSYGIQQLEP